MNVIIADDEKYGRESLILAIEKYCPELNIIAVTENVKDTITQVGKLNPDILFLDIEMPDGDGFDVVKAFENPIFDIIFVTAHGNFAINAIKISALDYIVKPIDPEELIEAVNKALKKRKQPETSVNQLNLLKENISKKISDRIVLPTSEGFIFVNLNEIVRCEAESNYTIFYLTNKQKIMVSKTLKEYDEILSQVNFFRIHNSHLVNMNHIRKYLKGKGGSVMMSDGSEVEVSTRKKTEFIEMLNNL